MHLTTAALFLALSLPLALATRHVDHNSQTCEHSMCYNYFLEKDGCVHSAKDAKVRCGEKKKKGKDAMGEVYHFTTQALQRRYDATQPGVVKEKKFAHALCESPIKRAEGVCLWRGIDKDLGIHAGWLNRGFRGNCGKQVWILNPAANVTVYASILGSCDFKPRTNASACFQIGLNQATFEALSPNADHRKNLAIPGLKWDYDNNIGQHPEFAPI